MTVYLDLEDLVALIADLGVGPIRELGLLESAAHRPSTRLWDTEAYPSIDDKAAALLESIVRFHPLVDGDKRLGWLSLVVFYDLNGVVLEAPDDPAHELVIDVASGAIDVSGISAALEHWRTASQSAG